MQKRKFDELISHFNRKVSDMGIDQKYKMELLGMISAIGFAHEEELSTNLAEVGTDCISRQALLDKFEPWLKVKDYNDGELNMLKAVLYEIRFMPPAQPEPCEYYALCRHGRDERKLRASLGICEYCNEDSDGYVKPIEKNNHVFVRFGMNGWELSLRANGWHGSAKIRYCPMCGRDLLVKRGAED